LCRLAEVKVLSAVSTQKGY